MNKKQLLLILTIFVSIIALTNVVSANNLYNINFNISSGFKHVDDASGLQFTDESNGVCIRILDENKKWEDGFTKYNETVYVYNKTIGGEQQKFEELDTTIKSPAVNMFSYGEYIKIDGKKLWVEFSNDLDVDKEPNYDKILESLKYFNEHNKFESVPT